MGTAVVLCSGNCLFSAVFWAWGLEEHWVLLFCCFAFLPWIAVGCVVLPGMLGTSCFQKPGFVASALQERVLSPSPVLCRDHSILLLLLSLLFQSKAPLMRKKNEKKQSSEGVLGRQEQEMKATNPRKGS